MISRVPRVGAAKEDKEDTGCMDDQEKRKENTENHSEEKEKKRKNLLLRCLDVVFLSLLMTYCSIPVFTAGDVLAAGSYTAEMSMAGERGHVFRRFWRAFQKNFRRGTGAWLLELLAVALFGFNIYYWRYMADQQTGTRYVISLAFSILFFVLLIFFTVHLLPVIGRFENTLKGSLRAAAYMSAHAVLPTLLITVFYIGVPVLAFLCPWTLIGFAVFGFGALAYFFAWIRGKILDRIEDEMQEDSQN